MSIPGISVGPNFPNNYPRTGDVNGADDDFIQDYNNFVSDVSSENGSDNQNAVNEYNKEGQEALEAYLRGLEGNAAPGDAPGAGASDNDYTYEELEAMYDSIMNSTKLTPEQKIEELEKCRQTGIDFGPVISNRYADGFENSDNWRNISVGEMPTNPGSDNSFSPEAIMNIFENTLNNQNMSLKDKLTYLFGQSEINFSNALTQEQIQALYNLVMEDTSMTPAEKFELLGKSGIDFSKVDPKFNELIEKYERASRRNSNNGSGGGGGTPVAQAANDSLGTFGGLTINSGSSIAQSYIFGTGHGGGGYDVVVQVGDAEHRYHEDGTNKS